MKQASGQRRIHPQETDQLLLNGIALFVCGKRARLRPDAIQERRNIAVLNARSRIRRLCACTDIIRLIRIHAAYILICQKRIERFRREYAGKGRCADARELCQGNVFADARSKKPGHVRIPVERAKLFCGNTLRRAKQIRAERLYIILRIMQGFCNGRERV